MVLPISDTCMRGVVIFGTLIHLTLLPQFEAAFRFRRTIAFQRIKHHSRHIIQSLAFGYTLRVRACHNDTTTLLIMLISPSSDSAVDMHLVGILKYIARERNCTSRYNTILLVIDIAAVIMIDAIDHHIAAKIKVSQQRRALLDSHSSSAIAQTRTASCTRPDIEITINVSNRQIRTTNSAFRCYKCSRTRANIRASIGQILTHSGTAIHRQRSTVTRCTASVKIDHSKTRLTIGIEQWAICIATITAKYSLLQQRILLVHLSSGRCGEILHSQAQ